MATDGVKIIDGDTAHDVYWGIMDLYDSGATIEDIWAKNPFPQPQEDYFDDFDYEIFVTAYALAIWEIGHMTADILAEVKRVIDKGVCVKIWTEEHSVKYGKARQKELDKLWDKISSVNTKPRKIKKYKRITEFLFNIDDILTFQLEDKSYCATILLDIRQYRGRCTYEFGKILYKNAKMPTTTDIINSAIIGRKIPSGHGMDITAILSIGLEEIIKQGGVDEILKREAEKTGSFVIGMDKVGIDHKDLINFINRFHKIGELKISFEFKKIGLFGGAARFNDFAEPFKDLENYIKIFKAETFNIKDIIDH